MNYWIRLLSLVAICAVGVLHAEEQVKEQVAIEGAESLYPSYNDSYYYFNLQRIGMEENGFVEDSVWSLGVGIEGLLTNRMIISGGLSLEIYDDKQSFSIPVEDSFGNRFTESSEITGWSYFLEVGVWAALNQSTRYGVVYGYRNFDVKAEIPNCSDCPEFDLDFGDPKYIKPFIKIERDNGYLNLEFMLFQGSDHYFKNAIVLGYSWST